LLETAVENNVIIIRLPSHSTRTLQPLDKGIFGPLKSCFKKEAAACKITRYRMARLIVFAWRKVASLDVGISAFECTGIYPFNRNIVPEYLLSISNAS
jgi:hypothetical protein